MREPLLLPLVAVACGIYVGQRFAFGVADAGWPAAAFALLAALPAAAWLRRITLGICFLFAGALLVAAHRPVRIPVIEAPARETVLAQGCVVEPSVFSQDRSRFILELEPGARALVEVANFGPLEDPPRLAYGQRVEIAARFRSPRGFENPGAFDYAAYLARRGIFWTALVPARGYVRVLAGECGSRWRAVVFGLRSAALDRISGLFSENEHSRVLLEAVLLGESARLERVWAEEFLRSGTYHALVISGLHVSVVAGGLLLWLRLLPMPQWAALAIAAAAVWLYALVSGFGLPVARSAVGFTLYLVARLLFRRIRPLNLLAAIALLFLAGDPLQLFDASFLLSFLAVAAIGGLAVPWVEQRLAPLAWGLCGVNELERDPHLEPRAAQLRVELRLAAETVELWTRIPRRWAAAVLAASGRVWLAMAELAVVSLSVQVGLALPLAVYFHRFSLTGLSANLLIVPLLNGLIPTGFLALLTAWDPAVRLARWLVEAMAGVARWHAAREPAGRVPDPPVWLGAALVGAIVACGWLLRCRRLRWPALAALAALLAMLAASPWPARIAPGELELTAIDVGQGDSLLLVSPTGATMLVDGGGRLEYGPLRRRARLDIGEDVVSAYLWWRGMRRLDVIAATHAHQDHTGGLAALLENFRPRELWTGANPPPALLERARRLGVRVVEARAAQIQRFGGALVQVLAPTPDYIPGSPSNNDSLVLRVTYGARSFLLTGDLERAEERRLLEPGRPPVAADVLKVGHHGSRTSTSQEFLDAVAPSIALISAGLENSFGHPHPEVVGRLAARGAAILRTDRAGLSTVRTDGERLYFQAHAWTPAGPLRIFPEHLLH
jgi:competence protein ComEC